MMLKIKDTFLNTFARKVGFLIFVAGVVPLCVLGSFFLYFFTHTILSNLETNIILLEKDQRRRLEKVMKETVRRYVRDRAIDIARELDLYIKAHPSKTLSDLRADPEFRKLAIQPIGKTGYTAVQTTKEPITCVLHRNKAIEMVALQTLASKYSDFYKIIHASVNGKYAYGFYKWYDEILQKEIIKFMYIVPLKEKTADGISLSVAATISLDEFFTPIKEIKLTSERFKHSLLLNIKRTFSSYINKGIAIVSFVFVFLLIVTILSEKYLTRNIEKVKNAFQEVNKGNFDVYLKPYGGKEIKELIHGFNRMVKTLKETTVKKESLVKTKRLLEKLNLELHQYIEKLKKAEEEKNKLIEDLKSKTEELETLIYIISHDLKSPLITIKGFLYFLEEDYKDRNLEKFKQDLEYIKKACDSMESLLKELLEFSRIGRKKEKFENISIDEVIKEVIFLLSGVINERKVKIEIKGSLPEVYGDRNRIKQVFQNLIENAIKYMGDQKNPKIEIGSLIKNNKEVIYVKDNGIGIPPEHHERIFHLFEQLDPESKGTGAGLAIVKKILKFHKGDIWVESEKGKGSTFYVYIPGKKEKINEKGSASS